MLMPTRIGSKWRKANLPRSGDPTFTQNPSARERTRASQAPTNVSGLLPNEYASLRGFFTPLCHVPEVLTRPEPAKGARGQQAVDEAVDDFLQGHAPRLAPPDAVAQMSQAVGEERRSARYAEDGEIGCAGRDGTPGKIGNEKTDDEAIDKPHPEELGHGGRTAGNHGQRANGPLLEFFYRGRRLHLFGEAIREHIEAALQASGSQGSEKLVLVGELVAVAAVVRQQHVHDGAGDKDDDGGKNNGEPKSREGNHRQPPW